MRSISFRGIKFSFSINGFPRIAAFHAQPVKENF